MAYKTLQRSSSNKYIGGVCGGLGEYFNIDPIIFRLVFVILFFAAGGGLLIYIIMWIITPLDRSLPGNKGYNNSNDTSNFSKTDSDVEDKDFNSNTSPSHKNNTNSALIGGIILIIIGALYFCNNYFSFDFSHIWPIILIALGIVILLPVFDKKNNKDEHSKFAESEKENKNESQKNDNSQRQNSHESTYNENDYKRPENNNSDIQ